MLVEAKPFVRVLWLWALTTKAPAATDPMDLPPQLIAGCISNLQLIWAEHRGSAASVSFPWELSFIPVTVHSRISQGQSSCLGVQCQHEFPSFFLESFFPLSFLLTSFLFLTGLLGKKFTKALPCDLVFLSQSCWPENSSVIWILTPSAHAGVLSCQFLCFFCTLSAELLLHALSCAQLSSSQGQVPTVRTHCCVSSIFFPADNHICSAPKMEEGCYFFFHVKGTWGKVTLRWEFVSSVLCTRERSCQVYVVDWNTDIWSHP